MAVCRCVRVTASFLWLNRMLLPDTVGTGGDSHTRFPIGISFPAGSGLVAFAAATGVMPLDMPESVLVRFKGKMQPGITLRDLVHAIPLYAIKQGLLTVEKKGKKNIFSGRILEIEGLPDLKVEQAFELTDASAERSAAGCTIKLNKEPIIEYLNSNIVLLKWMIAEGYGDRRTTERRIQGMEKWLANPELLEADADAEYAAVIDIDLADIKEPILCAPNDPDDARPLSAVQGEKIDEVFIGSCMTNIGHFRAAGKLLDAHKGQLPTRLWVAPPTRMDAAQLTEEGYYSVFGKSGARIEILAVPCVWVTRRVWRTVQRWFPPLPVTSRTVWVLARMSSGFCGTGGCCGADWQTADAGRVPDLRGAGR